MGQILVTVAFLAAQATLSAQTSPVATASASQPPPVTQVSNLAIGTPIRLMVLREVNTHTAKPGDRFPMRVDEPVFLNGAPIVQVGETAWGEVVSSETNHAAGGGGKLGFRLLWLDHDGQRVPLQGSISVKGAGNGAGVLLGIVAWGPFGLLIAGDSARLKGGATFTAYVSDRMPEPLNAPSGAH